jgi:hypothetical protein
MLRLATGSAAYQMTDHAQPRSLAGPEPGTIEMDAIPRAKARPARRTRCGTVLAARVAAVSIGLLLPLVMLEIVIRLFGPILPGNYDTGSMVRRDPILGHFHPASTYTWVKTPQFTVRLDFNAMGLRDPRQSYAKPPGIFRVLLLGDSYVEASQVPAQDTMAARMEAILTQATGRPVEVINGGVLGYGTTQEYLLLDELGPQIQPDLVVLFFCHCNDLANNNYRLELIDADLKRALKPYFDLSDTSDGLRLIPPPPPSTRTSLRERLRDYSMLYNVIETGVVYKLELQNPQEAFNGVDGLLDPVRGKFDFKPTGEWDRAWRITELSLERVRDRAGQLGAPLAIVGIPAWRMLDHDYWRRSDDTKRLVDSGKGGPTAPVTVLDGIARRLNVPDLDLTQVYQPLVDADGLTRYFLEGDYHWTVDGNEAAAEAVSAFLTERGLMPR